MLAKAIISRDAFSMIHERGSAPDYEKSLQDKIIKLNVEIFPLVARDLAERQGVNLMERYEEGDLPVLTASISCCDEGSMERRWWFTANPIPAKNLYEYRIGFDVGVVEEQEDFPDSANGRRVGQASIGEFMRIYGEHYILRADQLTCLKERVAQLNGDHYIVRDFNSTLQRVLEQDFTQCPYDFVAAEDQLATVDAEDIHITIPTILHRLGLSYGELAGDAAPTKDGQ